MVHVSVTRLRLRSFWFLFPFAWHAGRCNRQIRAAEGCLASDVRGGPDRIFWTKSVWRDEAAMRAFMASGAHLRAMPKLKHWCDEASAGHWLQDAASVSWTEAEAGLERSGRLSKVLRPSPAHTAGSILGSPK
jgi:quinol monooxygenase YgiN